METLFIGKNYTVKPGVRYAFSFISGTGEAGGTCSLYWLDDINNSFNNQHLFTLADGTTTTSTAATGGWEVVAPTNKLAVYISAEYHIALVPIVI
jgi:hypothetical protein